MKEGYLQTKINELNDLTNLLNKKIEEQRNIVDDFKNEVTNFIDGARKSFKPLLDSIDIINTFNESHLNFIKNNIDETKKELYFFVSKELKEVSIESTSRFKKWSDERNLEIEKALEEVEFSVNLRLDNLIHILNKKMGWNLKKKIVRIEETEALPK
jgi:hypothetical protein